LSQPPFQRFKSNSNVFHYQFGRNIHTAHDRAGDRTFIGMEYKHSFGGFPLLGLEPSSGGSRLKPSQREHP